jgi:hypothetical protein
MMSCHGCDSELADLPEYHALGFLIALVRSISNES